MRFYCDHNATTPPDPRVIAVMEPWWRRAANASSLHTEGRAARRALEDAREQVAALLGADPRGVTFTSGATEANNLAVRNWSGPCAVSAIEHPSVLEPAASHADCRRIGVEASGIVSMPAVTAALRDGVRHLALMAVNNETGAIQPWREAAAACAEQGATLHVDAVQAAGRISLGVPAVPGLSLALSGHKIGATQGVGVLWCAPELRIAPLLRGGGQERQRRPGTENIAAIAGMGEACRLALAEQSARAESWRRNEEAFLAALRSSVPNIVRHGPADPSQRVSGTLSLRAAGVAAERLCMAADLSGVSISMGSACSSGAALPSTVLKAMGKTAEEVVESFRVSLGWRDSESFCAEAGLILGQVLRGLMNAG